MNMESLVTCMQLKNEIGQVLLAHIMHGVAHVVFHRMNPILADCYFDPSLCGLVFVHGGISLLIYLRGLEVHDHDALVDGYKMLLGLMAYLWWRLQ
jgi:hypothetical protein